MLLNHRVKLTMKDKISYFTIPYVRLAIILFFGSLLTAAAIYLALLENNYSFKFKPGMIVQSSQGKIKLEESDFIAEPGYLKNQQVYDNFILRQEQISKILSTGTITVADNSGETSHNSSLRKLNNLPLLFWTQILVGFGGLIISGWIWSLKPKNLATTFFFLSGVAMLFTALPSAIYTTRLLAIPGELIRVLSLVNGWSAPIYGLAMVSLFLIYPRRGFHSKKLIAFISTFFILWTFACTQGWGSGIPDINIIIVALFTVLAGTILLQYLRTKNDPKARAILVWLGVSVLFGCAVFIFFNTVPVLLGLEPLEQGYAFLSFLFIYIGIALGLKQYRLFEVGDWAYRFLFYAVGAIIFVMFEATLVFAAGMDRFPALGVALIFIALAYLPLRDYAWRVFNRRRELQAHELLSEALNVAFAPSPAVRLQRWEILIKKLYDPLEISYCKTSSKNVELDPDGVALTLPAIADISALRLAYPWSGRSLFNLRAVETARQVMAFIEQAETSRQAYDRGVNEERVRIAQDLHDDVGARLLTGLHSENSDLRSTIQGAMTDIRTIIKGIAGEKVYLSELLANLRSESHGRLKAVEIDLVWPLSEEKNFQIYIDYHLHKTLASIFREVISNTIKHAKAKKFLVTVSLRHEYIEITTLDDGEGFPEDVLQGNMGFGLRGISKRITDLGGKFKFSNSPHALISITLPIDR